MENLVSIFQIILGIGLLVFALIYVVRSGINNLVSRIAIVISIVLVVHGGFYVVRAGTKPPEVLIPEKSIHELPRQLGNWQGKDGELDPKIFARTGAYDAVDRFYADSSGNKISLFVALYTNPAEGVYHSATNCYRSSGWTMISETRLPLKTKGQSDISVSVSTWDSKGERILVLYWYELDKYTLFERIDLGKVRWALRGRTTWPPLYKVLLQTSAADPELAQGRLLDIASSVHEWLGTLAPPPETGDKNP